MGHSSCRYSEFERNLDIFTCNPAKSFVFCSQMTENSQDEGRSKTPLDLIWTDVEELLAYVTGNGKILSRKLTRLSAIQQRHITRMIKRARNMLLMK